MIVCPGRYSRENEFPVNHGDAAISHFNRRQFLGTTAATLTAPLWVGQVYAAKAAGLFTAGPSSISFVSFWV